MAKKKAKKKAGKKTASKKKVGRRKVAKKTTRKTTKKAGTRKTAKKKAKKKSRRTVMYSSGGKKLYAVRAADGSFKDIQTYQRAHSMDIARDSAAEQAPAAT